VTATSEAGTGRAGFLPLAEGALGLVTLATVAGMWRLFADGSFFVPLALHAVAAHVLAAGLRRRGVAPATSALLCLVAGLAAIVWGHLLASTTFGIPTGATATEAVDQLELAWRTFGEVRAPAPVLDGFLLSAGAALWIGVWLADLAAFRLWTPFEALIPCGTLFVFASLFSADRSRLLAAALWFAAALLFVLLHRCARQQTSPSWLGSNARHGTSALVRTGAGLAAFAVLAGWLVGPKLPGAEAEAVFPFAQQDDGGSRITISPLVEIQRRLVEQAPVQLFVVDVDQASRSYWRLTALDTFDGEVWSSHGSFGGADGDLEGGLGDDVPQTDLVQRFTITGLAAIWLPAAFEAAELEVDDVDVRWDEVSSTLIVGRDEETSDGITYEVTSAIPAYDPAVLAAATGDVPGEVAERGTALPPTFPAAVTQLANDIVSAAGATTDFARARALQDSFRDGSFTYSLDVPAGHSDSAIEEFLFTTRTGYCEQFAGTYAAMARSIGLPARVAVGFTPGDPDPNVPGRMIVRGEHAHAWPEVWIRGVGWVAFEPTPGRGAPGAEAYTGAPESQDTAGEATTPTTVPQGDPAQPTPTSVPAGGVPGATTIPEGEGGSTTTTTEPEDSGLARAASLALLVIGAALGLALVLVAAAASIVAVRRVQRRRRIAAAADIEALVLEHGRRVAELVAVLGVVRHRWETATEFTRRVAGVLGLERLPRLGTLLTRAEFDPAGLQDADGVEAAEHVAAVEAAVALRTTPLRRFLAEADPRSTDRRARARGTRSTGPRIQISLAPTDA
jgi:transglutaminase-like putative cysteine protease